LTTHPN